MANRRIDQLNPNLNPLTGAELIPIFDTTNNTTERISITTLGAFIDSTNDTFINAVGFSNSDDLLTLYRNDGTNLTTTINRYNRWYVPSGQTLTIPSNFQSFIYGDFYLEGTLFLDDNSQLIVINGDIIVSGGTISGSGTTYLIDLPEYNSFVTNGVYNLTTKSIDFTGNFGFSPFSVDLSNIVAPNIYTTGATLNGGVLEFNRNDSTNAYSVDLSSLRFTGNTFDTPIVNFYVSNIFGNSPITIQDSIQSTGSTSSGILSFAFGNNNTSSGDYSHAGGVRSISSGSTSFIHSTDSLVSGDRSVVLGGQNITGATADTVYVPNLNINTPPSNDDALTQILVRDTDGTIKYRVSSSIGGSVLYSNVIFVDAINGNDSTGTHNDFTKPFLTMVNAASYASTLTLSTTNRCLIYVRRGSYSCFAGLSDHVDYYSEPGVVYTSGGISSTITTVTANFYGHASFVNSSILITTPSTWNIEFDYMSNIATALYIAPASGTATVNVKANYIYSTTQGSGYAISIRNNANVTLNVARGIEAIHSTIAFRFFTGNVTINCPKIYLGSGNIYGGNFKQAIICYDASTTGTITINGDIENKGTVDYGGIGSLVTIYSGANPKLTINGNLKGGPIKALDGNTQTSGTIQITGNITSDNSTYTAWAYGNGELVFKNCIISNSGLNNAANLIAVNGSAQIFFKDCYMYNASNNSNLIVVNSALTKLVLDGCSGQSSGATGNSIYSSVGAVNVRVNNSRFGKDKSVDITDLYSPSGFIYDTNTIVPTKIN